MNKLLSLTAILAIPVALAACEPARHPAAPAPAAAVTHSVQGLETATGTFHGASNHATSGTASVFRVNGHWVVSLGSDFSFDGAPDPHVALGHDGYLKTASLGKLRSNHGAQVYMIPDSLDVADYNEVWIWCDQFNVPLGTAKLRLL
jgi:hypothetical protein